MHFSNKLFKIEYEKFIHTAFDSPFEWVLRMVLYRKVFSPKNHLNAGTTLLIKAT